MTTFALHCIQEALAAPAEVFHVYAHNHDELRVVACCEDFDNAVDQAFAALNDWMAYSEVRRDDETLWDSQYGYVN